MEKLNRMTPRERKGNGKRERGGGEQRKREHHREKINSKICIKRKKAFPFFLK